MRRNLTDYLPREGVSGLGIIVGLVADARVGSTAAAAGERASRGGRFMPAPAAAAPTTPKMPTEQCGVSLHSQG